MICFSSRYCYSRGAIGYYDAEPGTEKSQRPRFRQGAMLIVPNSDRLSVRTCYLLYSRQMLTRLKLALNVNKLRNEFQRVDEIYLILLLVNKQIKPVKIFCSILNYAEVKANSMALAILPKRLIYT